MSTFEVDFKYTVDEESCEIVTGDDAADAEARAHKVIAEFYPEARNIEILGVHELNG